MRTKRKRRRDIAEVDAELVSAFETRSFKKMRATMKDVKTCLKAEDYTAVFAWRPVVSWNCAQLDTAQLRVLVYSVPGFTMAMKRGYSTAARIGIKIGKEITAGQLKGLLSTVPRHDRGMTVAACTNIVCIWNTLSDFGDVYEILAGATKNWTQISYVLRMARKEANEKLLSEASLRLADNMEFYDSCGRAFRGGVPDKYRRFCLEGGLFMAFCAVHGCTNQSSHIPTSHLKYHGACPIHRRQFVSNLKLVFPSDVAQLVALIAFRK